MDGAEHTAQRSLVSPYLHGGGLDSFAATVEASAHKALDPLFAREKAAVGAGERDRGRFDFVGEFSAFYPVDVVAAMMDLPEADYPRLQGWYNAFINFVSNITLDPVLVERGLQAKQEFGDYMLPIIASRRGGEGADLISELTRSEVRGQMMDDEEIRTFLALVLLGGAETTDHQLAALVHTLAQHPDQLDELRSRRDLLEQAMAEGMRYCSIVQFIQRTAREDFDLDQTKIAAGQKVTLMLSAANHDPRRFENAGEFDIHRTDNSVSKAFTGSAEHCGFGGGRHQCVGSQLSKKEVEHALNIFLDNTRDVRLADGYVPQHAPLPFIRSLLSLDLTFEPV